jgi:hypothetical protein
MSKRDLSEACKVVVRDHSGHDVWIRPNGTREVQLSFVGDPGKTEQSHKDICEISYILGQHAKAGLKPALMPHDVLDLTALPDYQTCLNSVLKIDDLFDTLSVDIKSEFDHDPARLMAALRDPSQEGRLVELGVLNARVKPTEGIPPVDEGKTPNPAEGGGGKGVT